VSSDPKNTPRGEPTDRRRDEQRESAHELRPTDAKLAAGFDAAGFDAGAALKSAGTFGALAFDDLDRDVLHLQDIEATIVGAGRAGSMIALVCGMLGIAVRVYDADRLGPENQGLQVYHKQDVLRGLVQSIAPNTPVRVHETTFEAKPDQPRSPIVIVAVDTMETRRRLWNALKDQPGVLRVLDVRLGRALVQLHDVRPQEPDDVSAYEASLYDDASAAADDCTDAATSHAAAAAAALVGGAVRAFVEGLPRPRFIGLDVDRALWAAGR
jgi:hypothetical protein